MQFTIESNGGRIQLPDIVSFIIRRDSLFWFAVIFILYPDASRLVMAHTQTLQAEN